MTLTLHEVSIPILDELLPKGTVFCPEMWIFGLLLQFNYYRVDFVTAITYTAWTIPQMIAAQYLAAHKSEFEFEIGGHTRSLLWITTCIHILGWLAQFYGHGVHEGRAPALMDNLGFMFLAPFFATFECLNYAFSYREGPEMDKVRVAINKDIEDYKASRGDYKKKNK